MRSWAKHWKLLRESVLSCRTKKQGTMCQNKNKEEQRCLLAQAKGKKMFATYSGNITDARKSLGGMCGSKPGEPVVRAGVDGAEYDC